MPSNPFSRPTTIAAVEFLERLTQAQFNQLALRLGLENNIPSGTSLSVGKKCAELGREVVNSCDRIVQTVEGDISLGEAVVMEAIKLINQSSQDLKQAALARGLARDGYTISWDVEFNAPPILRKSLPDEIDLPETDDEVHQLLKHFNFLTSLGHLNQAIDAHTRGNWAAANGQIRSFLESLFDEIFQYFYPSQINQQTTSENKHALLAKNGFLSENRKEWTTDGKNFINGLFKMLHTEGSHAGLSDEDHSTFRLQLVLVTSRAYLKRLHDRGNSFLAPEDAYLN